MICPCRVKARTSRGIGVGVCRSVDGGVRGGIHPEGRRAKDGELGVLMDNVSSMVARAFILDEQGRYPYLWERGMRPARLL